MKFKILVLCMFMTLCSSYAMASEASHRAAAEELLLLTDPDATLNQVWGQVDGMMTQQFEQMGAPEELKPLFDKYTGKMLSAIKEEMSFKTMKDDFITIYVNTYTEEELRAIGDFYKSPAGQAFLVKMPKLIQESMAITQKKMGPLTAKIQAISMEMDAEVKKLKEQQAH